MDIFFCFYCGRNGNIYKFDIAGGALLQTIATGSGNLFGVSVFGEITAATISVPEPGTILLLLTGLFGLGAVGFARRREHGLLA